MPRYVNIRPLPATVCPCCKHFHSRGERELVCLGSPDDWDASQLARLQSRPFTGELQLTIDGIDQGTAPAWEERIARALSRRNADLVLLVFLSAGECRCDERDQILYAVAPQLGIALRCGKVLRITRGPLGSTHTEFVGPARIAPSDWPSILVSRTGVLLQADGKAVEPVDAELSAQAQETEVEVCTNVI